MFNTIRRAGRKTNNACKGWNSHFKKLLNNVVHPPFYPCIQGLQRDVALADNVIALSRAEHRHRHELRRNFVIAQNNLEGAVTEREVREQCPPVFGNNLPSYSVLVVHVGILFDSKTDSSTTFYLCRNGDELRACFSLCVLCSLILFFYSC